MPALDSLPAPAIILGSNNGRWSQFPPSQNVQMELITRARQNLTAFLGAGTSTKLVKISKYTLNLSSIQDLCQSFSHNSIRKHPIQQGDIPFESPKCPPLKSGYSNFL
jgi:hypothetical protein